MPCPQPPPASGRASEGLAAPVSTGAGPGGKQLSVCGPGHAAAVSAPAASVSFKGFVPFVCVLFFFFHQSQLSALKHALDEMGRLHNTAFLGAPSVRTDRCQSPLTKGCASQPAASLPWSGRFGTARQTSGLPAISTLLDTITKRKASQKPQRARPSSPALPSQPAPCPPCNRACAVAKLKCFHTLSLPNIQQSTSLDAVCLLDPLLLGVTHLSSVAGEDP